MSTLYRQYYDSPIGLIEVETSENAVCAVSFVTVKKEVTDTVPILQAAMKQLDEYFKGKRYEFLLPFEVKGTDFQMKVWDALQQIPYGETRSYKDIAINIGNELAVRAVGGANNKNKIAIMIPCHRVIGSNKQLIGYESGLEKKQWLLNHEEKSLKL
ncbi:MAG TPA: cysteine methyltransferase [Firmicutes bacterium]|nr:cysteine methyltransferase [Bacillota bacterium]